jgi:hypothetical protein
MVDIFFTHATDATHATARWYGDHRWRQILAVPIDFSIYFRVVIGDVVLSRKRRKNKNARIILIEDP